MLSRFIAEGAELPLDAVAGTGVMLSMRPKPGRIEAAGEATGADDVACGVTTVAGGEDGTTTTGAGCLLPHAPSNAKAKTDTGRIRNLLISSLLVGNLAEEK
jgi:hypothetical protein